MNPLPSPCSPAPTAPRPARLARWGALAALAVASAGCVVSTNGSNARGGGPGQGAAQAGPGGAPGYQVGNVPGRWSGAGASQGGVTQPEVFRPRSVRQRAQALLKLPGAQNSQLISYDVVDGMAVLEGDVMLGPASQVNQRYGASTFNGQDATFRAVAVKSTTHLWPGGQIPYVIDPNVSASTVSSIQWAIGEVGTTQVKLRPRTPADQDYVVFRDTGGGCTSYVGRIGGPQEISVTGCSRGSVAHEILHAAGFYHEQSRSDRDEFITIVWSEIDPAYQSNFQTRPQTSQDIGGYDYASIMHYSAGAFSRSGRPTIIPKVPGAPIGQRDGLSQLDRAAIATLYGGAPPPPSVPGPQQPAPPQAGGSFAGQYTSAQGNVACTQSGSQVACQFGGGNLTCVAQGDALSCVWSGSAGQGRATFRRQATGVLSGSWGDLLSDNSRGAWELVPAGGQPAPGPTPGPAPQQPANPWWPFPQPAPGQPVQAPQIPGLPPIQLPTWPQ